MIPAVATVEAIAVLGQGDRDGPGAYCDTPGYDSPGGVEQGD